MSAFNYYKSDGSLHSVDQDAAEAGFDLCRFFFSCILHVWKYGGKCW